MKRKLSNRSIGVVAGVIVLAYALGGYFLLVSPKKSDLARLDQEIAATSVELSAARAAARAQDDAQPIAVADIFRLAKAMPSGSDMPGILLELARIAEETGIRFKSITPQPGTIVGTYSSIPVNVTFDGTFYALSDFLFRLRTLVSVRHGELHAGGRLFAVESVDFSEAPAGFPTLAASIKLQAFVYGTDVPGGEAPPPAAGEVPPPATTEGAEVPPPGSEATASGATG